MRYRIDQEQLSEFLTRQVRLVERLPLEAAEAAADGYGDGLDDAEREALWLAGGIATFIGQAIADEPERFISGPERLLSAPTMALMTAAVTVFSNHRPPSPIVDRIGRIAPRSVFLIYADPGMGGESTRQPKYHAAAGDPKAIWKVPGSEHTGGIDATPPSTSGAWSASSTAPC